MRAYEDRKALQVKRTRGLWDNSDNLFDRSETVLDDEDETEDEDEDKV